jgi:GT2 family glycosyltransferase
MSEIASNERAPNFFIGIVTVLFNSDDVLQDFFKSLSRQGDPELKQRLYVIDNSPTPSGTELAQTLAEKYDIDAVFLFNKGNLGVAAGNNIGIKLALDDGCTHVLLANNDTEFPSGIILGMLRSLVRRDCSAITPKIKVHGQNNILWYGGAGVNTWTLRFPHFGIGKTDNGDFDRLREMEYAPTCFMLVTASAFDLIGIMDEKFFCYYDDTDFVYRLRRAGGKLIYDPSMTMYHKVGFSTGGNDSEFSLFYMTRNRIYFGRKHLRGMRRITALAYVISTRFFRMTAMDKPRRQKILAGVRSGLQLAVVKTG